MSDEDKAKIFQAAIAINKKEESKSVATAGTGNQSDRKPK